MTHGTNRTTATRMGMVVSFIVGGVLGTMLFGAVGVAAPDIIPTIRHERNDSKLYEDGSYILGLGEFSIAGCAPLHLWNGKIVTGWCMDGGTSTLGYFHHGAWVWTIGIDSPWEDYLPLPLDSLAYWTVDLLFK